MSSAAIQTVELELSRSALKMPFVTALRTTDAVQSIRVEIRCADGSRGFGEATPVTAVTGETLASVQAAIRSRLIPAISGIDGDDLPAALGALHRAGGGRDAGAVAALDIALHDLRARRRGISVCELLAERLKPFSPPPSAVATDMTLSAAPPEQMALMAAAAVSAGFGVLKLKLGDGRADDLERVLAVAEAAGPAVVLRIDANQGWDVPQALRMMAALERRGIEIELLEQPVPREDLAALGHISRSISVPVLADEAVWSAEDVAAVGRAGAANAVNIKLMKCGGLAPALKAVATAAEYGLGWIVGCMMEGAIGVSAAAALAAAGAPEQTHDLDAGFWQQRTTLRYANGRLLLPASPGLGVER